MGVAHAFQTEMKASGLSVAKLFGAQNAQLVQTLPLGTGQHGSSSFVFGLGVRADVQLGLGLKQSGLGQLRL
jgi:hypothetical protein